MANNLTEEQIADIKETFRLFDKNGDGTISAKEMATVVRAMGQNPTAKDINRMMKDADSDGTGKIEYSEFLALMSKSYQTKEAEEDEMLKAFKVFDKDGSGFVTKGELRTIMTQLGERLNDNEVDQMMRDADADGDGRINYSEFVKIMMDK